MNAHIYLEYLVQFIDYPLEAGELMCLENMAPKTFQRSHQTFIVPYVMPRIILPNLPCCSAIKILKERLLVS